MKTAMKNRFTVIGLLMIFGLSLTQPVYADKWQEGKATIGNNNKQKECPVGSSSTARAPGCTHPDCTAAKQQAKANLRAQFPTCGAYIHDVGTCLSSPDC